MTKEIKIEWKKDSQAGICEVSGTRTQWIATSKFGSIRCSRDYKPFGISLDAVAWNKILSKKIEMIKTHQEHQMNKLKEMEAK